MCRPIPSKKIPTCPAGIFFFSFPRALLRKAKI
jgi:hypothetical protein